MGATMATDPPFGWRIIDSTIEGSWFESYSPVKHETVVMSGYAFLFFSFATWFALKVERSSTQIGRRPCPWMWSFPVDLLLISPTRLLAESG